jgi:hypothetical protein
MRPAKVVALVFGVLGLLVGAALIAGATSILTADRDDGYFTSEAYRFDRQTVAVTSEDLDVLTDAPSWLADWLTDPVSIRFQATAGFDSLFMGIAPTSDVSGYLAGVAHDEVTDIDIDNSVIVDVTYETHLGTEIPPQPGTVGFWTTSVEGIGIRTLDWSLETGNWTVVLMNSDASPGVVADVTLGAKIDNLIGFAWIGMAFGVISVLGGGYLTYRGARPEPGRGVREDEFAPPPAAPAPPVSTGSSR